MATRLPDDTMLPPTTANTPSSIGQHRIVAFVPISIAVIGVAAILLGRVTAHDMDITRNSQAIDPIETGSISVAPTSGYGIDAVAR